MLWARKSKLAKNAEPSPLMIGLDLNSSRAAAVEGLGQATPRVLPLDQEHNELALVLNLGGRQPLIGREAAAFCRSSPHLICQDFLASLGDPKEWTAGRHHFDASRALAVVVGHLKACCTHGRGLMLTLPSYLSRQQVALLTPMFEKAGLPLLGTLKSPLALGLAAHALSPWQGSALMIDVDDHSLSAAGVVADGDQLWVQKIEHWPKLNLRAWKMRLLDAVADRCIRQSRRDPRDCPAAEQSLYDQIEPALVRAREGKIVELLVQTDSWYQNLLLPAKELIGFSSKLVAQTVDLLRIFDSPRRVVLSGPAARLPGLLDALQTSFDRETAGEALPISSDDFGEALLPSGAEPALVTHLADNAAACAAHQTALRIHGGEIPRSHFESSILLPKSEGLPDQTAAGQRVRLYSAEPDR